MGSEELNLYMKVRALSLSTEINGKSKPLLFNHFRIERIKNGFLAHKPDM